MILPFLSALVAPSNWSNAFVSILYIEMCPVAGTLQNLGRINILYQLPVSTWISATAASILTHNVYWNTEREGWTNKQRERQIDKHVDRQMNKWTDKRMDR